MPAYRFSTCRLASYLEAVGPPLGLTAPGVRVLELGAGLGWLGCTLARNLPDVGMVGTRRPARYSYLTRMTARLTLAPSKQHAPTCSAAVLVYYNFSTGCPNLVDTLCMRHLHPAGCGDGAGGGRRAVLAAAQRVS